MEWKAASRDWQLATLTQGLPAMNRRPDVAEGRLSPTLTVQLQPQSLAHLLHNNRHYKKLLSSPALGPPLDLAIPWLSQMVKCVTWGRWSKWGCWWAVHTVGCVGHDLQ